MKTTLRPLAVATALGLMTFSNAAIGQEAKLFLAAIVQEENAEARISLSGKLRMLSQRIPSAACHMAAGVDTENATKLLTNSVAEFEKILKGLEFGDGDLGIRAPESRRMTISKIQETREIWSPFKAAAMAVAEGSATDENLQAIFSQDANVLGSTQSLVSELIAQYSNSPSAVQADLFAVDIAGRQRMLTQKMAKESCLVTSNKSGSIEELQSTMQMFEISLEALRFGMPELGIRKPPNPMVASGLVDVLNEWKAVKPMLASVVAGETLDADTEALKFKALNQTMAKMNAVVDLYVEATKPST